MISITFLLVCVHEGIHFLTAYVMGLSPKLNCHVLKPSVYFRNKRNDIKNLIVATSSPLLLTSYGVMMNPEDILTLYTKILCLTNLLNFLPFTSDGEVILISIINLVRRK